MILILLFLLIFKVENIEPNPFKCRDRNGKEYESLDKIHKPHSHNVCNLCECQLNGKWACRVYPTCMMVGCIDPTYGEVACCEHLKCQSINILKFSCYFNTTISNGYYYNNDFFNCRCDISYMCMWMYLLLSSWKYYDFQKRYRPLINIY